MANNIIAEGETVTGKKIVMVEAAGKISITEGKNLLYHGTEAGAFHKWQCLTGAPATNIIREEG